MLLYCLYNPFKCGGLVISSTLCLSLKFFFVCYPKSKFCQFPPEIQDHNQICTIPSIQGVAELFESCEVCGYQLPLMNFMLTLVWTFKIESRSYMCSVAITFFLVVVLSAQLLQLFYFRPTVINFVFDESSEILRNDYAF